MATNIYSDLRLESKKSQKESIHSGQFMISLNNEDDDDGEDIADDTVVEGLPKNDNNTSGVIMPLPDYTELQTYTSSAGIKSVSDLSNLIDSDLSTVFRTLNVAYT